MVSIIDNSTRFDFDLTEIASLFGITLDKENDERENCVLVLAPVMALLRDMVLRRHNIPDSLWDILLTLANTIESLTYPSHE